MHENYIRRRLDFKSSPFTVQYYVTYVLGGLVVNRCCLSVSSPRCCRRRRMSGCRGGVHSFCSSEDRDEEKSRIKKQNNDKREMMGRICTTFKLVPRKIMDTYVR